MSAEHLSQVHRSLGLSDREFEEIRKILGREPTTTELAMYSVMWSEHCSYKSSRVHLAKLPSDAPWVVIGPGENAGVVEVGDGIVAALRIESHNHPSAVEPFQGASTGVGGIIRDVLSMGARPVLLGDPLRFGPLKAGSTPVGPVKPSEAKKNLFLMKQVVAGISHYGNAVGVPTIGGEIKFAPCYSGNPLVNVFCLGIAHESRIQRARATNPGDSVILLGASTGRDGIGGVSILASAGFDEDSKAKRPSVQVGDPFEEKKLIEACLEIFRLGLASAIQDLGGAGISCAASETAARGGTGIEIDVAAVHRREPGMTPEEVVTSESQERMFVTAPLHNVEKILEIAGKWGLQATVIGKVIDGSDLVVRDGDAVVARVPASSLADGPKLRRPSRKPESMEALTKNDVSRHAPGPSELDALMAILGDPSLADRSWIWRQYDHQLFVNTVLGPGEAEAAVVRVRIPDDALEATLGAEKARGEKSPTYPSTPFKGLAVAFEGGGRFCHLDPREGAKLVVAEATRKVACVGAKPVAVVDCLNFGNPEHPEVMWEFEETIEGMAEACSVLKVPVVGGNVSFYNETAAQDIWPTPVVAAVGRIDALERRPPGIVFFTDDLVICVIGRETESDLNGSAYAWSALGHHGGAPPRVDLGKEAALHAALIEIIERLNSESQGRGQRPSEPVAVVHDLSTGGLAAAIAESCLLGEIGAQIDLAPIADEIPKGPFSSATVALFSETPSRVLIAVEKHNLDEVRLIAARHGLGFWTLGMTGGTTLCVNCTSLSKDPVFEISLEHAREVWQRFVP
ncbi:MAG: phosphoribosylformylglycinamidine synthase subunit PurL [Acidimicrobiia bacterium]